MKETKIITDNTDNFNNDELESKLVKNIYNQNPNNWENNIDLIDKLDSNILLLNNDASFNNVDISGVLKGTSGIYNNNQLALGSHIIPISNADYDLGNAEYKIRHLFLSDNSIWIGDKHKIDISNKIKKF